MDRETMTPTREIAFTSRRTFIGGSDTRIIMGNDEAALLRLWREKRGEVEPEPRHFALQQTASVPAMTPMRLSSERIRFHLPWRKPVSRFVLHDVPCKDSERTMIGGRKSADGFSGSQAGHSSLGKKCTSRSHSPPADAG